MQTMLGRAFKIHLHGGSSACSFGSPAPWSPRRGCGFQVARVVAPVVPEPAPEGFENRGSPHPDAVRRRREAEARRKERMRELAEISAHVTGRSTSQPPNMITIDCVSEFDFRVQSGSRAGRTVVAHFKSPSCQSCVRLQPKLKRAARENPDIPFLLVDVSDVALAEMCLKYGIDKIPYFQVHQNGELVSQGQWGQIDLLRKSGKPEADLPMCSLSKQNPADSHSGRWKRTPSEEGEKMGAGGIGGLDLLVQSSALEWVPLEDGKDAHCKNE
ncbi:hypothetical protein BSKO_08734 [Bryopsis sp. KO-2023]|nr:hypothetical protein BSKO_08734 [Bryopsis sp. KO-2023]